MVQTVARKLISYKSTRSCQTISPCRYLNYYFQGGISYSKAFAKNCCGLDVHKTWIYACVGITNSNIKLAEPYSYALQLVHTVPGFDSNPITAIATLAEIGADMSVFPTAKHLSSWTVCCPRNDQSGCKRKSTHISSAGALLVQIANAVIKSDKHPEFKERYRRIKTRRGHKKAVIAIYHLSLIHI